MIINCMVNNVAVNIHAGTSLAVLLGKDEDPSLIAALVNGRLKSLSSPLHVSSKISPITLKTSLGHKVYRKTLCFLLEVARRRVLPHKTLRIGPSLGNGYLFFTEEDMPVSKVDIRILKNEMESLIDQDLQIASFRLPYQNVIDALDSKNSKESLLLVKQKNCSDYHCLECAGEFDLEHFPLADRTSRVSLFDLESTEEGLILKFPEKYWPLELKPAIKKPLLINETQEYLKWDKIMGISSVPELNVLAQDGKQISDFLQVAETFQEKRIGQLADKIAQTRNSVKLILIAGPSSSGKTTFTKKLAVHLKVLGFNPRMISLDDYFVDREKTPKDSDGRYDFEALAALDIDLLNHNLVDLLEGKAVATPLFDFKSGTRKAGGRQISLGQQDILLMEGIHALNGSLTPKVSDDKKFKIYISPLTALTLDSHNRISTTDNRLIRRIVRDYQFRGYSAQYTLSQWPSVRRGEEKNIFPFQEQAQEVFNSALDYEPAVLAPLAIPLLRTVAPDQPEYTQASYLITLLENFVPIKDMWIPTFSILREFIGHSGFKY